MPDVVYMLVAVAPILGHAVDPRDDAVLAPRCESEDSIVMSFPDRYWSLRTEVPGHNPPVGISRQEASVSWCEVQSMHLSRVASEDESWLRWGKRL